MENTPENKIYSAGYADTFNGSNDFSSEYSCFYEKEPDGSVGSSNLYILTSGSKDSAQPEVAARFAAKKMLYEYFHSYDYVDANKLALAMRSVNNEIYEYAKVQGEKISTGAIAAAVTDGKVAIATVGGARAYIIRNEKVFQITEDPAVIDEKVQSGELTKEEAYGPDGVPAEIVSELGIVKDITTDVYDGIEVRAGDTLLLCSASLDTFIGKKEILDATADNNPRKTVQQMLTNPSLQNANVPASVAAIRIYDESTVDTMIRVDGDSPADTDLNVERKELELLRKNRPQKNTQGSGEKKKDKLPGIILGVLLALMLLAAGVWAAAKYGLMPDNIREKYLGNLVPSTATPTPTIDWVRESMSVLELTAEAEKAAAVAATVAAWPTQTPYPTFTPVFIDLEDPTAVPTQAPADEDLSGITGTDEGEEPGVQSETETEEPAVFPTAIIPTDPTAEPIVKDPYVEEKSGVEMLYVPAGNFILGSDPTVDGYTNTEEESPQVTVNLDGFWIGRTEVTNAQYLRCVEAGVCEQNYNMSLYVNTMQDYPVTYVSADQAERFCSWIGGHLPTEYQWEKAARGTDARLYPWGDEVPTDSNDLANVPYYVNDEGFGNDIMPVGSFPNGQSPYGLMDMAGNVWEWTSTWYSINYYDTLQAEEELSGTIVSNPTGPENGSTRVMRGGSAAQTEVNYYEAYMRTANRSYINMNSSYWVGFRCMVPDTGEAELPAEPELGQPGGPQGPQEPQGPRP